MADDSLVRLRNENSKLKQRFIDLERTYRKLGRERKKLTKEVKRLKEINKKLDRNLIKFSRFNRIEKNR
jgi:predicted RNase H-like nuclease (RuvC/YqgF family)